jgi:hypothetical protein
MIAPKTKQPKNLSTAATIDGGVLFDIIGANIIKFQRVTIICM